MRWLIAIPAFVLALLLLELLQWLVFNVGGPGGIAGSIVCVLVVWRLNAAIVRRLEG